MILKRAGSELSATTNKIFSEGAVWQNKIAKALLDDFLNEQRIEAEEYQFMCPISINSTNVVMDFKCKPLM